MIELLPANAIKSESLALLDVSFNHLTSLEKSFSQWQRLVTLIATGNSIESVLDLGYPATLRHLYLDENPIQNFQVYIPALRKLRISLAAPGSQAMATISQISTAGIPSLEVLQVTDSPLALDPFSRTSLAQLTQLKELHLTRCDLSAFGPESENFLDGLSETLEKLHFDGNRLRVIPSAALKCLKYLEELNLSGNDITKIQHGEFEGFPHLRSLDISYNVIDHVDRYTFTALEGLEVLNLSGNKIKEIPEGTFSHLHHLHKLDLTDNQLQHLHSHSFEPYALQDNRITVNIERNPWVCDCHFKWVVDHSSWDSKANTIYWDEEEDNIGPFYDALDGE